MSGNPGATHALRLAGTLAAQATTSMFDGAFLPIRDRAAANATALMTIGLQAQHVSLPGLCSHLVTVPLVTIASTTGTGRRPMTNGRRDGGCSGGFL